MATYLLHSSCIVLGRIKFIALGPARWLGSTEKVKVTLCLLPLAILSDVHTWFAEGRINRPFNEKMTSSLRRV